uniref:Peptidylprolyl isomerase n=1 Tax=Mantoniella antarctica TaxID=81844 RepID=A0A7S0SJQ8_9CHLO|mmetsp:Transcript_26117/g.65384  ORF Transcript_26117/g.65384 Transcript_26117/m.65384 type:complete len:157 (+) Transcript_26117:109-579(+)
MPPGGGGRVLSLWVLMLGLLALTGAAVPAEEDSGAEGHGAERDGEVPVLEPGTQEEKVRQIRFGETVKLDDIGPIIVNADCSMRRISNYDALTQREKTGAQQRIAARNAGRLRHCRELEDRGELHHHDIARSTHEPPTHIAQVSIDSVLADDRGSL